MSLLFVGADDTYMLDVAERLAAERVSIASVITIQPATIRARLGREVECIDSRLLYRAKDVRQAFPTAPAVLSRGDLQGLLEAERHFTTATDRTTFRPTPARQRYLLFRELVRYFAGWLDARAWVDTLLFESTPHMGWDIVLFHVARMKGLRTLIVTRTLLDSRVLLIEDYRISPGITPDIDTPAAQLENAVGTEFAALVGSDNPWTTLSMQRNVDALRDTGSSELRSFTHRLKLMLAWWRQEATRKGPAPFASWVAGNDEKDATSRPLGMYRIVSDASKLRRAYGRLIRTPDLSADYVYFAMHYQPERTSQPEALEFHDHLLAVTILSAALPAGWKLYVKEHPRQFTVNSAMPNRRHARTAADYEELARVPNVELVSIDTPSGALIARSRACSTLTGSTGWEAIVAGKPALIFGPAWYADCASVFYVQSVGDAKAALDRVTTLMPEQVREDLLRFLLALKKRVHIATTSARFKSPTFSYTELVNGLATAVARAVAKIEKAA